MADFGPLVAGCGLAQAAEPSPSVLADEPETESRCRFRCGSHHADVRSQSGSDWSSADPH